ncbi:MAG TPA: hypothetical protein VEI98_06630 [Xanthobacteraceae bacterium]|nr:hypothetical protein [Xanthobacteraceae bacterium]
MSLGKDTQNEKNANESINISLIGSEDKSQGNTEDSKTTTNNKPHDFFDWCNFIVLLLAFLAAAFAAIEAHRLADLTESLASDSTASLAISTRAWIVTCH